MSYKSDLEDSIRTSYDLIRQYNDILRFSGDPKEQARAQYAITEQWKHIKNHLDDYIVLCKNLQLTIADDLKEIMAHFPEFDSVNKPETHHLQDLPQWEKNNTIEVLIYYAQADKDLQDELIKQLSPLQGQGLIRCWHCQIEPETYRKREIDTHLENAKIILLLISADFMASKYYNGPEMRQILKRQEAGKTRVIPIILRSADWQAALFGKLQALPHNGKPVTTWENRDAALLDVVSGIRKIVESIQ